MSRKKKIIIIISAIAACFVIGLIILIVVKNSRTNKNEEKIKNNEEVDCVAFTGGSYNLKFETNGGDKIESMTICIACSPDSYEKVPIPTKEGDTFEGWYYDKNFKKKMTETSTGKIEPVDDIDKNGCLVGYKDITLYAKWSTTKTDEKTDEKKDDKKEDKKSSSGSKTAYCEDGSKPSNGKCTSTKTIDATLSYTCGGLEEFNDRCIENTLPAAGGVCPGNSTYSIVLDSCFETTNDDEETCISKGGYINPGSDTCTIEYGRPTQLVCDGERAGMELVGETCVSFVPMTPVYTCSEGTLDGTKCIITIVTDAKYK